MPSFKIIGHPVLEKIFKGFYHLWAWHGGHLGQVTSIMSSDFHFLVPDSTANIKAVRESLWSISVNKLSPIPKLQSVPAVYKNQ